MDFGSMREKGEIRRERGAVYAFETVSEGGALGRGFLIIASSM